MDTICAICAIRAIRAIRGGTMMQNEWQKKKKPYFMMTDRKENENDAPLETRAEALDKKPLMR